MKQRLNRTNMGGAGESIARMTLWILLGLLLLELFVEAFSANLGFAGSPYTFLWIIGDRFDDYFKFVLSFPVEGPVHGSSVLREQVATALSSANPYRTDVSDLARAAYSHFHTPPLVALFCLANAALMRFVDPGFLYLSLIAALASYWLVISVRNGQTPYQRLAMGLAGLLAYPMMLMAARGNVYAGATGLLIVHAMLLAAKQKQPMLAAVLLGLAINIRPNAIVLLPLLPLLFERRRLGVLIVGMASAAGLFGAALAAAHLIYPDYTWSSFQAGLGVYYRAYVLGGLGPAFSSSLFAVAKMLLGYRPGLDLWAALPGFGICAGAVLLAWKFWIEPAVLLFLLSTGYCLSSALFCDYHLMPFMAVPLVLAHQGMPSSPRERCALIASCLVLSPKCYVFGPTGLSPQVLLNPLILLVSAGWILGRAIVERFEARATETAIRLGMA